MRKIRVCSATFVRRAAALSISLVLSVFLASAQAATIREYYTIQVGSYSHESGAKNMYRTLKTQLPKRIHDLLRVERVGQYYALRIGDFRGRASTAAITAILEERKKDWVLRHAPIKAERLRIAPKVRLYPPAPRAASAKPSPPHAPPKKERRADDTASAAKASPPSNRRARACSPQRGGPRTQYAHSAPCRCGDTSPHHASGCTRRPNHGACAAPKGHASRRATPSGRSAASPAAGL